MHTTYLALNALAAVTISVRNVPRTVHTIYV
jgi:hypothetical protein